MAQVRFGNVAPVQVTRDDNDELVRTELAHADADAGESVSEFQVPDDMPLGEAFVALTAAGGAWEYHSDTLPTWVSSDSPDLAKLLAAHFTRGDHECEVRKYDAKVVTAFGDPTAAKPASHRAALAGHAKRLGAKGSDEEAGT